jgi:hypothetical protein
MAFTVPDIVKTVEFRSLNTGMSNNGNQWMSLKVEYSGNNGTIDWEITVPKDLQGDIFNSGLRKGDICDIEFSARAGTARSGSAYSYLQLERVPSILEVDEDGVIL